MNTQLDAVTFQAQVQQPHGSNKLVAYAFDNHHYIAGGKYATNKQDAIISLYMNMTELYYSFRLQVVDNGEVVQELTYAERH